MQRLDTRHVMLFPSPPRRTCCFPSIQHTLLILRTESQSDQQNGSHFRADKDRGSEAGKEGGGVLWDGVLDLGEVGGQCLGQDPLQGWLVEARSVGQQAPRNLNGTARSSCMPCKDRLPQPTLKIYRQILQPREAL